MLQMGAIKHGCKSTTAKALAAQRTWLFGPGCTQHMRGVVVRIVQLALLPFSITTCMQRNPLKSLLNYGRTILNSTCLYGLKSIFSRIQPISCEDTAPGTTASTERILAKL